MKKNINKTSISDSPFPAFTTAQPKRPQADLHQESKGTWLLWGLISVSLLACPLSADPLTSTTYVKVVTSATELMGSSPYNTGALAAGGTIYIRGTITTSAPANVTVPGTQLIGLADGSTPAKLVYTSVNGTPHSVIKIQSANVRITGLDITTNQSLSSNNGDAGIEITAADASGFIIEDCNIHDVSHPILRAGNTNSVTIMHGRIVNNSIHSFTEHGIEVNWRALGLLIDNNRIWGRDGTETHTVNGNGIWIGNYMDLPQVSRNDIAYVGRHGVEIWNSQSSPANTGGNEAVKVLSNTIHHLGRKYDNSIQSSNDGSFGISAFGCGSVILVGNSVNGAIGIGMEIYNDSVNTASNVVTGNSVQNVTTPSGASSAATGIAFNYTQNALVASNHIGLILSQSGYEQFGMQFNGGCSGVTVVDNNFVDSGNRMIYVNGNTGITNKTLNISRNTFRTTTGYLPFSGYPVAISLQSLRATAVCRDNVSWYDSTGTQTGYFRINGDGSTNPCNTYGTAYISDSGSVVYSGTELNLGGSNLNIGY